MRTPVGSVTVNFATVLAGSKVNFATTGNFLLELVDPIEAFTTTGTELTTFTPVAK